MDLSTWLAVGFSGLSFCVSAAAFWRSGLSLALARQAEDRARESVRPFIGTGVHAATGDMQVTLSNYGAGVAIIHRISFRREGVDRTGEAETRCNHICHCRYRFGAAHEHRAV